MLRHLFNIWRNRAANNKRKDTRRRTRFETLDPRLYLTGIAASAVLDDDIAEQPVSVEQTLPSFAPTTTTLRMGRGGSSRGLSNVVPSNGTAAILPDPYESDDHFSNAAEIATNGAPQSHSIHVGSDIDWVRFTLPHRSNVTIQTSGLSGDTRLRLYRSDGTVCMELNCPPGELIAHDDDGGEGLFSLIRRFGADALDPGTYYVRVDEFGNNDAIAAYAVSVLAEPLPSDDHGDTFHDATTIKLEDNGSGRAKGVINWSGDGDMFAIVPTRSGWMRIDQMAVGDACRRLDTYLYVYDSDGRLIASDDDAGEGLNSRVEILVEAGKRYFVKAAGFCSSTGAYELLIHTDDHGNSFDYATGIVLDGNGVGRATGVVGVSGDQDMFRIDVGKTGRIEIQQRAVAGSRLDSYLYVYDRYGRLIASNDDSGGSLDSRVCFSAQAGETYYIEAAAYGSSTGEYELLLRTDDHGDTVDDATTVPLNEGGSAATAGVIESRGDVDMYRVVATQTGTMTVRQIAAAGSRLDPYLYVYDSRGRLIASNDDSGGGYNSRVEFAVTSGEVYYVKAAAYGSSTGEYALQFQTRVDWIPWFPRFRSFLVTPSDSVTYSLVHSRDDSDDNSAAERAPNADVPSSADTWGTFSVATQTATCYAGCGDSLVLDECDISAVRDETLSDLVFFQAMTETEPVHTNPVDDKVRSTPLLDDDREFEDVVDLVMSTDNDWLPFSA